MHLFNEVKNLKHQCYQSWHAIKGRKMLYSYIHYLELCEMVHSFWKAIQK